MNLAKDMQQTPHGVLVEIAPLCLGNSTIAIGASKSLLPIELVRDRIACELLETKCSPIAAMSCAVHGLKPSGHRKPEVPIYSVDPDEHGNAVLRLQDLVRN